MAFHHGCPYAKPLCLPAHTAMVLFDPDVQGVYTEELATWLIEADYDMACNINAGYCGMKLIIRQKYILVHTNRH